MSSHSGSSQGVAVQTVNNISSSPKYSLSGISNAIYKSKSNNGYLSTLFGRSSTGAAERLSNYVSAERDFDIRQPDTKEKTGAIPSGRSSSMRTITQGGTSSSKIIGNAGYAIGLTGTPSGKGVAVNQVALRPRTSSSKIISGVLRRS